MWRRGLQGGVGLVMVLALGACAANADDDLERDGSEVVVSNNDDTSKEAAAVAESIRQSENRPRLIAIDSPDTGEAINTNWNAAAFRLPASNGGEKKGLVFYPLSSDARQGSYVVVLASEEDEVAAMASYVPDSKSPRGDVAAAKKLLAQLESDAKDLKASTAVKTQALNLNFGALGRLASRLFQGKKLAMTGAAAEAAVEARVLKRATNGELWLQLRSLFEDLKKTDGYISGLIDIRKALGSRKVVLFASPRGCAPGGLRVDCVKATAAIKEALKIHVQGRENVAIAVRSEVEYVPALIWALKNKVSVVMTGTYRGNVADTLDFLGRNMHQFDEVSSQELVALAKDPNATQLVTMIGTSVEDAETFHPLWSLADEAISIDAAHLPRRVRGWLRGLERLVEY